MENKIIVNASGELKFNNKEYKCAIGKNGITTDKKEGDWATPAGCMPIREVYYRADRLDKPITSLPLHELKKNDGWCDDQKDPNYNKFVKLPYDASHEELWREDEVYDVIVVLGHNDDPPVPGKGSAIFMHVARPNYSPTAGCVALALGDLLEILESIDINTEVCIVD